MTNELTGRRPKTPAEWDEYWREVKGKTIERLRTREMHEQMKASRAGDIENPDVRAVEGLVAVESRMAEINTAIEHWEKLATAEDETAAYHEGRCEYGGVARNRAGMFRRTAEALRLELKTGKAHCACCLKPR